MIDLTREMIAYGIIGAVLLIGAPWTIYALRQRKRTKLRRRGVKTYGY